MREKTRESINNIATECFEVSVILILLLIIADTIHKGFVSNFFNSNILIIVCLISGMIALFTAQTNSYAQLKIIPKEARKEKRKGSTRTSRSYQNLDK